MATTAPFDVGAAAVEYLNHHGELTELLTLVKAGARELPGEARAVIEHHRACLDEIEQWLDAGGGVT